MNVGTIGHVDHGKTTLTAAITKGYNYQLLTTIQRFNINSVDKKCPETM